MEKKNIKVSLITYIIPEEKTQEYLANWKSLDCDTQTRQEEGNFRYDLAVPVDRENRLYLTEYWRDNDAVEVHKDMQYYKDLCAMRDGMGVTKGEKDYKGKLVVIVTYKMDPSVREKFISLWKEHEIAQKTRAEKGCSRYDLAVPIDKDDQLFLFEYWDGADSQAAHRETEHFKALSDIKNQLGVESEIETFDL